jgi:hypothetical protein
MDPKNQKTRKWTAYQPGYVQLAAFIADDPDNSTTIFRKFDRLSARTLLHMEIEIARLEHELEELDQEAQSRLEHTEYPLDKEAKRLQAEYDAEERIWEVVCDDETDMAKRRHDLVLTIRRRLKEYCRIDCGSSGSHASNSIGR